MFAFGYEHSERHNAETRKDLIRKTVGDIITAKAIIINIDAMSE